MSNEMESLFKEITGGLNPTHVIKQDLQGNTLAVFVDESAADQIGTKLYPEFICFCCYGGYLKALMLERAPTKH